MLNLWNWLSSKQKKLKFILELSLIFTFIDIFGKYYICIMKFFFRIPCPGCGLTRAFRCIFRFDFAGAMHFNILSPFIFLFLLLIFVITLYDLIHSTEYSNKLLHLQLRYYHYVVLALLMLMSWYFNIERGI